MGNVVPVSLQRLRAADIMQMAGLMSASLGQEYSRVGAVNNTFRQGDMLLGRVDVSPAIREQMEMAEVDGDDGALNQYRVAFELKKGKSWTATCYCRHQNSKMICPHVAALLYEWLAHPIAFAATTLPSTTADVRVGAEDATGSSSVGDRAMSDQIEEEETSRLALAHEGSSAAPGPGGLIQSLSGPFPSGDVQSILSQLGLSELRGIAREYEISTAGVGKARIIEQLLEKLHQPEAVRRVAATLEKQQRQLLAAVALAGGSITDEDLRGLYERFHLGQPAQFQTILLALQGKALLFRTSLNNVQSRPGLSSALLDIGWFVPDEVRAALRVAVPVTPFDVEGGSEKEAAPVLRLVEPYSLQSDLLLIAHALDGHPLADDELWIEQGTSIQAAEASPRRTAPPHSHDGSMPIPAPFDMPPRSLLQALRQQLTASPAFLRFAIRLLRLAGVIYKDEAGEGPACVRVLSDAARLLLGPGRIEMLHELFELWLTQSTYGELYELQEHRIRLRCRTAALNMPLLRPGELEAENSEARQVILGLLAQAPFQQWIHFSAFARFIYRLNPLFLQRRQRLYSSPHWWMEQEQGRPLRPLQSQDWVRAEYHYLSYLIGGPLHWWGLADIALSNDGRLLAFRLTPLASRLLAGVPLDQEIEMNEATPAQSLEATDNSEILVACSPASWPFIEVLEHFTEAAGVRHDRLCYRLTPQSLGAARSQGLQPARLRALLEQVIPDATVSQQELLTAMMARLERWHASYGRVRIYTGVTLLEVADGSVMRELSAMTSLDTHIVQSITPTIHIIEKTVTERLLDDLKRRGQPPLVHDEDAYGPE